MPVRRSRISLLKGMTPSLPAVISHGARVGTTNGNGLYYRVYSQHFARVPGYSPIGEAHDDWRQGRAGFLADLEPDCDGEYGETPLPVSPYQQTLIENEEMNGGNPLAHWTKVFDEKADWSTQLYFDQAQRGNSTWICVTWTIYPLWTRPAISPWTCVWRGDRERTRNMRSSAGIYLTRTILSFPRVCRTFIMARMCVEAYMAA